MDYPEGVIIEFDDDETETFTKAEIMASVDVEWLRDSNRDVGEILAEMRVKSRVLRDSGIVNGKFAYKMQAYAMVEHWTRKRLYEIEGLPSTYGLPERVERLEKLMKEKEIAD